VQFTL